MTVGELLSRMTASELAEWKAYYSLEPLGDERADLRAAIVASTVANVHVPKGKAGIPLKHFMAGALVNKKDPTGSQTLSRRVRSALTKKRAAPA